MPQVTLFDLRYDLEMIPYSAVAAGRCDDVKLGFPWSIRVFTGTIATNIVALYLSVNES
jgi:hypothetical protein